MAQIFALLRARTGHDFAHYKPSTIQRRIERRLATHKRDTVADYLAFLEQTPGEIEALFRDLLIGVTCFFRDPEAFTALEQTVIPRLFADVPPGSPIRIWSVGCSTGEEAYSLAILLLEQRSLVGDERMVQIFATDLDSRAIATARTGRYGAGIATDLTPERLARWFTPEPDGKAYRIDKAVRSVVVFSEQDAIQDPPFSKLDLIVCRNLLIYFDASLQKRLIPRFHYALNPGGWLFLGSAEGIGESDDLFSTLDRGSKLFQRKEDALGLQRAALGGFIAPAAALPVGSAKSAYPVEQLLREVTEQALLLHLGPCAALVNAQGDILYLHGRTGLFLEPAPGHSGISNIVRMAREGLRPDLVTALHAAVATRTPASRPGISVRTNGHFTLVDLSVLPLTTGPLASPEAPLYLVVLAVAEPGAVAAQLQTATGPEADNASRIAALMQELRSRDACLKLANEELESSTEELKSANEEMQSVNEELATVNTELQTKVADLTRANTDMNNLLAGTGIGTVLVDRHLRLLRFTPSASVLINLIPGDVGRPLGHLVTNLMGYDRLGSDVQAVLDTLIPSERDVLTTAGRWYSLRMQPYRTLSDEVDGVMITFADLTETRQAQQAMRETEWKFRALFEQGPIGVAYHEMIYDATGKAIDYRFLDANGTYVALTGVDPRGKTVLQAFPGIERDPFDWIGTFARVARSGESIRFERFLAANSQWYDVVGYQYRPDHFVAAFVNITERKRAEALASESKLRLEAIFHGARDAILLADPVTGTLLDVNPQAEVLLGRPRSDLIGQHQSQLHPPELRDALREEFAHHARGGNTGHVDTHVLYQDGSQIPVEINSSLVALPNGQALLMGIFRDVRERVRMQEQLHQSEKMTAIGQLAGGIAHDFNNQLTGISGYAELLRNALDNPRQRGWAEHILGAAQRSADLTRQLLAFARKGQTRRAPTDLRRTISEVVELLHRSIDPRIVIIHEDADTPCLTLGDAGQLHHALLNLALNARDAMPGGGELRFTTRQTTLPEDSGGFGNAAGTFVAIAVGDTGCGMDTATRRRLFEPFFTTKTAGKGTGLGLAAVYGVIKNHGGAIAVDSHPGRGSTFTLLLPLLDAPPAATPVINAADPAAVACRILAIDDEPVVRDLLEATLHSLGHVCVTCADAEAALTLCQGGTAFDLVILDMIMPRMGGRDAFLALRARNPGLRVLVASGHSLNGEVQSLLDLGARGFIQKPFQLTELSKAITEALSRP